MLLVLNFFSKYLRSTSFNLYLFCYFHLDLWLFYLIYREKDNEKAEHDRYIQQVHARLKTLKETEINLRRMIEEDKKYIKSLITQYHDKVNQLQRSENRLQRSQEENITLDREKQELLLRYLYCFYFLLRFECSDIETNARRVTWGLPPPISWKVAIYNVYSVGATRRKPKPKQNN